MAESSPARMADVRMSRFERLPWRRIILVVLGVLITVIVVVGSYRTLSDVYSAATWRDFIVEGVSQGASSR